VSVEIREATTADVDAVLAEKRVADQAAAIEDRPEIQAAPHYGVGRVQRCNERFDRCAAWE
jgi:hypothetical protein